MRPLRLSIAVLAFVAACGRKEGEGAPVASTVQSATAASASSPNVVGSVEPAASASAAPAVPMLWLVASDPTVGAKQPGAIKIGCDDWLVPKPASLTATDTKGRLVEAVAKLLGEMKSKLAVASVKDGPDGALLLDLKGTLSFGGLCDPPRLIQPVERTAGQFGKVTISVNGQARTWRCANDESGKCL